MRTNDEPRPTSVDGAARDAAITAGRAHERAGRRAEAVAAYGAAQRLQPDPALAQRILSLRCDLACEAPVPPGAPVWPRTLADPFPGATAPPEVEPHQLTGDLLGGSILHHGCLIVRGLLEDGDAAALRDDIRGSIEARDRAVAGTRAPGDDDWYHPFDRPGGGTPWVRKWMEDAGGMLMVDSPSVMWRVLDHLERSGVPRVISEYLQEPAVLSSRKSVLRYVREATPTWHQDGAFMGASVRSVDLWIALSDCGRGTTAAGLDILPMRVHDILETQTHGSSFLNSIGQGLVDIVGADRPWIAPHFAAGDAILFDERFVHRSGVSEAYGSDRYAIEAWFFGSSSLPEGYLPISC
jgi:hypothetical protein